MRHPDDPFALPGQVVGLLGGSFDPPHLGHLQLSREALRRLRLNRIWWLVSPGNPLKSHKPAPLAERLAAARALLVDPRICATDIEARLGTRATIDTLAALRRHYWGVNFVWLMGADNLVDFHRWHRWRMIFAEVPIAVFARPLGRPNAAALLSPAARAFAKARLRPPLAHTLARLTPPAWVFLTMPLCPLSSSALRAQGVWPAGERPALALRMQSRRGT